MKTEQAKVIADLSRQLESLQSHERNIREIKGRMAGIHKLPYCTLNIDAYHCDGQLLGDYILPSMADRFLEDYLHMVGKKIIELETKIDLL